MHVMKGYGVTRGTGSGRVFVYRPTSGEEPAFDLSINQKEALQSAIEQSIADLEKDVAESRETATDTVRMVFEAHKLMANDPLLVDAAIALIDAGATAYQAYKTATEQIVSQFRILTNEYMRNRVIDIIDATDRVLHALVAAEYEREFNFSEPHVIVMDQMRPSVIRNCHKPHIVGFIAESGAYDQHSSMIARTKDLPGVIVPGITKSLHDGDYVTIDGNAGTVVIDLKRNRL